MSHLLHDSLNRKVNVTHSLKVFLHREQVLFKLIHPKDINLFDTLNFNFFLVP
jgi:hypothetical protein